MTTPSREEIDRALILADAENENSISSDKSFNSDGWAKIILARAYRAQEQKIAALTAEVNQSRAGAAFFMDSVGKILVALDSGNLSMVKHLMISTLALSFDSGKEFLERIEKAESDLAQARKERDELAARLRVVERKWEDSRLDSAEWEAKAQALESEVKSLSEALGKCQETLEWMRKIAASKEWVSAMNSFCEIIPSLPTPPELQDKEGA